MDLHINAGHRWADDIEVELALARAVLTLWSSNSIKSRFVLDEAHDAANRNIIVPAKIEDVIIPYGFRQIQTADLIEWSGEPNHSGVQQILASLQGHLNGSDEERR